ncbi:MAG: DEAD/DEAH box helicase [Desulfobacteraceae bacterium]|nr:MAG: DEAD/DEAH box helicase [Desulfobacteraceae bacterium]
MDELIAVVMPDGALQLEWAAADGEAGVPDQRFQNALFKRWRKDPAQALLWLGFADASTRLSVSLSFWRAVATLFVEQLRRIPDLEDLRHKACVPGEEKILTGLVRQAPAMIGGEYVNPDLLRATWERLNRAFSDALKQFSGPVAEFFQKLNPNVHLVGRVFFHLVENKGADRPFAFLATYSSRLGQRGQSKHLPLKQALTEYGDQPAKLIELLATVHRAAARSPLLKQLLDAGELFHPLAWSAGEAWPFLKDIPIYEAAGILCRIPDWWRKGTAKVRLTLNVGEHPPSQVGLEALLSFQPELMVGDTPISPQEAQHLLEESRGLALIKNRWVAVDPEKLRRTLDAYESALTMARQEGLSFREAMRLQLSPEQALEGAAGEVEAEVCHGRWLAQVLERLRDPDRIDSESCDADPLFSGSLRPYQTKGLHWLAFLHGLQLGACLADDMGLGKTVQVLAFLSRLKAQRPEMPAHLLVMPASLLGNWAAEVHRFAPHLKVLVLHPDAHKDKKVPELTAETIRRWDLLLTTYNLASRYKRLQDHEFGYVILDEAQAIKNPATAQARAVKRLRCRNRLALTGTPIENRLTDLWSLFDFLDPGLLGSAAEFKRFCKGLDKRPEGYARLRNMIGPYILRRMKTDRSVIADLPDKVEMKVFAPLSKRQVVLYSALVEELKAQLARAEGIARKGLVLAALMKFKQICNHPDQYLGGGDFGESDSGKFGQLREICETIAAKRERVLVFTQFREMTEPLAAFMTALFGRPGAVLHGGVAVGRRKQIVTHFQSETYVPFMVLSLKAGGVGLNLTAASHVVHFDRWWNPAVENQATDRAFRIGQEKKVLVHKFLVRHTVEEKIDAMLAAKTRLTQQVISGGGETWITEMSDAELIDLFRLSL